MKLTAIWLFIATAFMLVNSEDIFAQDDAKTPQIKSIQKSTLKETETNPNVAITKEIGGRRSTIDPKLQIRQIKPIGTTNQNTTGGITAKDTPSVFSELDYWDTYIDNAEKRAADLDRQANPNSEVELQKLERAIERAKIRKALMSQKLK